MRTFVPKKIDAAAAAAAAAAAVVAAVPVDVVVVVVVSAFSVLVYRCYFNCDLCHCV